MIFDTFTFFNELDILEIRLEELSPIVDKFVIVESTHTFQGKKKRLYFKENAERYERFSNKITHLVCEFPEVLTATSRKARKRNSFWQREFYQRNFIEAALHHAAPADIVMLSDVDEIVRKSSLEKYLSVRKPGTAAVFEMSMYSFKYNRRDLGVIWSGTRLIDMANFPGGQNLRNLKQSFGSGYGDWIGGLRLRVRNARECNVYCPVDTVKDAGWHFSSIGGWTKYREKINAYSHAEYKENLIYQSEQSFLESLMDGGELVGLNNMPAYIRENAERFAADLLLKE